MSNRFKLKPLALATLLVSQGAVNGAFAQSDEIEEDEVSSEAEVVEVTGFRGSLLKSQALKRNSEQVVDAIFAEDIGKSTDQNIADALSRVTGVSVQSEDGEGTKVTVRGANPDQNLITLNGSLLTSGDFNQSVDLSTFSSDVLSKIEVVKSSSADQDEGSLGASINLYTAKPLELKENLRSVTLQGRYSDFTEKTNSKIAGSFSQKFFDDKAGILVTAFDEDFDVRNDKVEFGQYKPTDVIEARDQRGNIVGGFQALVAERLKYGLNRNNRQRAGFTAALQFTPTSTTDISFDYSYTKQTTQTADDSVNVQNLANLENYSQGVAHSEVEVEIPDPSDPTDTISPKFVPPFSDDHAGWTTVDTDARTVTKVFKRFGQGSIARNNGGKVTENDVFNLRLTQFIGDSVQVELGVNSSKTELRFLPNSTASTASWNVVNNNTLKGLGPESDSRGIQPVGYDCSPGGGCAFEFGDDITTLGLPDTNTDNRSRTGFNPFDGNSQHVGNVSFSEQTVNDDNESVFVDVDWDVDFFGINKIEFGVKASKRTKEVDDQFFQFDSSALPITITKLDPITERPIGAEIIGGSRLSSIPLFDIATGEEFPVDNFLSTLGVPRSRLTTEGWTLFSADKIFDLAFGNSDLKLKVDNTKTRAAELKNRAAYFKFNFAAVDDRLTGNIGIRYVKTELANEGFAGVQYQTSGNVAVFDPFQLNAYRDTDLKPCPTRKEIRDINNAPLISPEIDNRREARLDGLGWNNNGTPEDLTDDVPIPVQGSGFPCSNLADFAIQGTQWWNVWNYSDISTELNVRTDPNDPTFKEDLDKRSFKTTGTNSYSLLLPSLTVNFALTDDIVLRFASSETMSRPNIDDLKPGFRLNENLWNETGSSITLGTPGLLPQRARNLDLAFEWYFDDKSSVSATYFRKNLTDFLETENQITYADEVRDVDFSQGYDVNNLILSKEEVIERLANSADKYGRGECHPRRTVQDNISQDYLWTNQNDNPELEFEKCNLFRVSSKRNGARGQIEGIELGYTQSFDFLPGIWGGLGTTINYTFQKSSNSREPSSIVEGTFLPEFPRAFTPEKSYNATLFWEQNGHQIRLAWRGKSDELIQRSKDDGALWKEGSLGLDMSATYKINEDIAISFNAINLTDTLTRNYWTSRSVELGDKGVDAEGNEIDIPFDEGSVFDGGANKSRTTLLSKTGRQYRIGLNVKF